MDPRQLERWQYEVSEGNSQPSPDPGPFPLCDRCRHVFPAQHHREKIAGCPGYEKTCGGSDGRPRPRLKSLSHHPAGAHGPISCCNKISAANDIWQYSQRANDAQSRHRAGPVSPGQARGRIAPGRIANVNSAVLMLLCPAWRAARPQYRSRYNAAHFYSGGVLQDARASG